MHVTATHATSAGIKRLRIKSTNEVNEGVVLPSRKRSRNHISRNHEEHIDAQIAAGHDILVEVIGDNDNDSHCAQAVDISPMIARSNRHCLQRYFELTI